MLILSPQYMQCACTRFSGFLMQRAPWKCPGSREQSSITPSLSRYITQSVVTLLFLLLNHGGQMARHLFKLDSLWQSNTHQANRWKTWALAETFRRTIFLANIIDVVCQRVGALNRNYSESLGDQLVLDLHMPAPEIMWTAPSCAEWEAAKTAAGAAATPITLRRFLDDLPPEGANDAWPDFTRMIISSAWKAIPALNH